MNDLHYVSEHEDLMFDDDESDFTSTCSSVPSMEYGQDEQAWREEVEARGEQVPGVREGRDVVQSVWVEFAARDGLLCDADTLTAEQKASLGSWFRNRRADERHMISEIARLANEAPWYRCTPSTPCARHQSSSASSCDGDAECSDAFGSSLGQSSTEESDQVDPCAQPNLDFHSLD